MAAMTLAARGAVKPGEGLPDDLVQQAYLQLERQVRESGDAQAWASDPDRRRAYLGVVCSRVVIDWVRQRARERGLLAPAEALEPDGRIGRLTFAALIRIPLLSSTTPGASNS